MSNALKATRADRDASLVPPTSGHAEPGVPEQGTKPSLQGRREMLSGPRSGAHNMRVPVLDTNRVPLMPTTQKRARILLNSGKASAYWNKLGMFCIILKREVLPNNQLLVAGCDPGSSFEGWSVVGTRDTVLNGMSEATTHVKKAVEQRRTMRRARRHRNCRRRPSRFQNRLRNKNTLPPSTHARWNAKLRIIKILQKCLPITVVVVEDVAARTWKGKGVWKHNTNFSAIEQGKLWFYRNITDNGLELHTCKGHETKDLRNQFKLGKTRQKDKRTFVSHAVDAWVLAASISGAKYPTSKDLVYWSPIRLHRRQLQRLEPQKGGKRPDYGGTRSLGISRGVLVCHKKFGLTYIGGNSNGKVSLHNYRGGKRLTQSANPKDLTILTRIAWRTQMYPEVTGRASSTV